VLIRLIEHLLRLPSELQELARATMRHIEREETGLETLFDFVTQADLTAWLAALPDPRAA